MLRTAAHFTTAETSTLQASIQQSNRHRQPLLSLAALCGDLLLNFTEGFGFQQLEGQVFQFPLEPADAEAVGERGINLPGFPRDSLPLLLLERSKGAHVVQPIRQLHQHHSDITGHGKKHPAQVLGLSLGAVVEMNATELGDTFNELTHLSTEMGLDLNETHIGVFHHIVEKACGDHRGTGADIAEQICHRHRMDDVWITTGAELSFVQLKAEIESSDQQRLGIGRAALADTGRHIGNALPQPVRQGNAVVVGMPDRVPPQFRKATWSLHRTTNGWGGLR